MTESSLALMSADEARAIVQQVQQHLRDARALLLRLHTQKGWASLGYKTWTEFVSCEFTEFSRSQIYRELAAGKLENELGLPVGQLPESYVRAVKDVLADEELQLTAISVAMSRNAQSAKEYFLAAVETHLTHVSDLPGALLWREGRLGALDAYEIEQIAARFADISYWIVQCTDPALARMLPELSDEFFKQVQLCEGIPTYDDPVPLSEATAETLRAWLTVESMEARARHIAENQELYEQRKARSHKLLYLAERTAQACTCGAAHDLAALVTIIKEKDDHEQRKR